MEIIDARGLRCPLPLLRARKALAELSADEKMQIWVTDLGAPADFKAYCEQMGHALIGIESEGQQETFMKITLARKP